MYGGDYNNGFTSNMGGYFGLGLSFISGYWSNATGQAPEIFNKPLSEYVIVNEQKEKNYAKLLAIYNIKMDVLISRLQGHERVVAWKEQSNIGLLDNWRNIVSAWMKDIARKEPLVEFIVVDILIKIDQLICEMEKINGDHAQIDKGMHDPTNFATMFPLYTSIDKTKSLKESLKTLITELSLDIEINEEKLIEIIDEPIEEISAIQKARKTIEPIKDLNLENIENYVANLSFLHEAMKASKNESLDNDEKNHLKQELGDVETIIGDRLRRAYQYVKSNPTTELDKLFDQLIKISEERK